MKQVFAIFFALVVTPMFSANAWIGGPFSANSYGQQGSQDGVYEAGASLDNGIVIYTIVVGHDTPGVNAEAVIGTQPVEVPNPNFTTITVPTVNSGNVFIGYYSGNSNLVYYQGVQYRGTTIGTVNPTSGNVWATSSANGQGDAGIASSYFQARIERSGPFVAASAFSGDGELRINGGNNDGTVFPIEVFGSKVSENIFFGL